jgi:hypothetical protein
MGAALSVDPEEGDTAGRIRQLHVLRVKLFVHLVLDLVHRLTSNACWYRLDAATP